MSKEFYRLCYDQYKIELEEVENAIRNELSLPPTTIHRPKTPKDSL